MSMIMNDRVIQDGQQCDYCVSMVGSATWALHVHGTAIEVWWSLYYVYTCMTYNTDLLLSTFHDFAGLWVVLVCWPIYTVWLMLKMNQQTKQKCIKLSQLQIHRWWTYNTWNWSSFESTLNGTMKLDEQRVTWEQKMPHKNNCSPPWGYRLF